MAIWYTVMMKFNGFSSTTSPSSQPSRKLRRLACYNHQNPKFLCSKTQRKHAGNNPIRYIDPDGRKDEYYQILQDIKKQMLIIGLYGIINMVKLVTVCFLFLFSSCSLLSENDRKNDPTYEKLFCQLQWVFEKGLPLFYSGTDTNEIMEFYKKENSGGGMPNRIYENQKNYRTPVVGFWIERTIPKSSASDTPISKIWVVKRYAVDIQDCVLEYWVVSIVDRTYIGEGCLFIVTKADNLQSSREIVFIESQFYPSVIIGSQEIQFPEDDLWVLYSLQAWRYPMSFINSDLKDYYVEFKDDTPYLKKISFFKRLKLNRYWKIPKS